MKKLGVLLVLLWAQFGFAGQEAVEQCAYRSSKDVMEIIKKTVGLRSSRQLTTILELAEKECLDDRADAASQAEVRFGVQKALTETFGDIPWAAKQLSVDEAVGWKEIALRNLELVLQHMFSDQSLTFVNQSQLQEKLETTQQEALRVSTDIKSLSGSVTLNNGFACDVRSEISEVKMLEVKMPLATGNCMVTASCRKGLHFQKRSIEQSCGAFN